MNISGVEKEIYAQYDKLSQNRDALVMVRHEYDDCYRAESDRARKNILRLKRNQLDAQIYELNKDCSEELNQAGKQVADLMIGTYKNQSRAH